MKMPQRLMEPWMIRYEDARYNLASSGIANQTLAELLVQVGISVNSLLDVSLRDNDPRGSRQLRKTIAASYANASEADVLVTAGVSEAMFVYFHTRYQDGANVVVPFPTFENLYQVPKYLGYEVRRLNLRPENGFRLPMQELEKLVDDKTASIVINTPHNPTGVIYSDAELREVINLANAYNADILADEHYRFLPHKQAEPLPSLYGLSPNVVALGSTGKCFGCIGLRVGWMLGPAPLIDDCLNLKDYTTYTICALNDSLARVALENREKIIPKYRAWILENVSQLSKLIRDYPEYIDWVEPEGGIVTFPYVTDRSIDSARFSKALVEKNGVFILPGEAFEMPGHFRIGFGVRPETFRTAMELMSDFLSAKGWIDVS